MHAALLQTTDILFRGVTLVEMVVGGVARSWAVIRPPVSARPPTWTFSGRVPADPARQALASPPGTDLPTYPSYDLGIHGYNTSTTSSKLQL